MLYLILMYPVYSQYCFSQKYCILGVFDLADSILSIYKISNSKNNINNISEYKFRIQILSFSSFSHSELMT